jgi:hypothetical protein
MLAYGPSEITHLSMTHADGSTCQHSFRDDEKRYSLPIASDEHRSLPVLECNKGCVEWALEERNGWKMRPEQVKFTQTEVENELAKATDARGGVNIIADAIAEAMRQQAVRSDGVDVRKAPTARKSRR